MKCSTAPRVCPRRPVAEIRVAVPAVAAGLAIAASRADVRLAARAAVLRPHRRHHPLHLRRHTKVTAVSPATPLILDLIREISDCFLASSPPILTGRTLFPRRRQDLRSLRNEADEKSNPRDLGVIWGGAVAISGLFRGLSDNAAYATGQTTGFVFGAVMFVVGLYFAIKG